MVTLTYIFVQIIVSDSYIFALDSSGVVWRKPLNAMYSSWVEIPGDRE